MVVPIFRRVSKAGSRAAAGVLFIVLMARLYLLFFFIFIIPVVFNLVNSGYCD
jgi:hypothetical protein